MTNLEHLMKNDTEAVKDLLSCDDHDCGECGFQKYREAGGFSCFTDNAVEWFMAEHPTNAESLKTLQAFFGGGL